MNWFSTVRNLTKMKFPHIKHRHLFLRTLHIWAFVRLPEMADSWTDKPVVLCLRYFLLGAGILFGCLMGLSTFLQAIHDTSEFIQRLLEFLLAFSMSVECFHMGVRLQQLLDLFDLQDRIFHVSNLRIYKKYARKENIEMGINITLNVMATLGLMFETVLPLTERNAFLMMSIYHRKHPIRVLPFNIWTPGFIDTSNRTVYLVVYLFEVSASGFVAVATFGVLAMFIVFPTPLKGQYEMFAEFVQKTGANHQDSWGENIFYTDVASGRYVTETQLLERR